MAPSHPAFVPSIIAGAAIVITAVTLSFRWFATPPALAVPKPDAEAAAAVERDFGMFPKVVAVIPIRKPPPAPDRSYPIPKAGEGEAVQPEPVVEASAEPKPHIITHDIPEKHDICARHGGRKIIVRHRHHESWRCVYPRG